MKVVSIVLAGGKNLRLGRNKALEKVGDKPLIERVIERLKPLSNQILVVTSGQQFELPVAGDVKILVDIYPDKGPLGGIYTGLLASQSSPNIVVACDMPFLNSRLLSYMIEMSSGFDAVVPRLGERRLEPLHAVYSSNCLESMKSQLELNQLEVNSFLNRVCVRYIERAECERLDSQLLSFFNINCQADLDWANAIAKTIDGKEDTRIRTSSPASGQLQ